MLFKPEMIQAIENGRKTQTRRIATINDTYDSAGTKYMGVVRVFRNGRLKWQVGRVYTICPGRGKAGIGKIRIKRIRFQNSLDIDEQDARAEGFVSREEFLSAFARINRLPVSQTVNVWALTFERVQDNEGK